MRVSRSRTITRIIIFALIVYACISLISLRGRIDTVREDLNNARRAVADMEVSNAQVEYEIENYNDPEVIADIARSELGFVLPGEKVYYDATSELSDAD